MKKKKNILLTQKCGSKPLNTKQIDYPELQQKKGIECNNRWKRTIKRNEKSRGIKPHKTCQINNDWCGVNKSYEKFLWIGH